MWLVGNQLDRLREAERCAHEAIVKGYTDRADAMIAERKHIGEMMKEYRRLPRSYRAARRRLYFKIALAMYNYDTQDMRNRY